MIGLESQESYRSTFEKSHILFPDKQGPTSDHPTLPTPRENSEVMRYFGLDMDGCDLEKALGDVNE
jgi:hypothetical protein